MLRTNSEATARRMVLRERLLQTADLLHRRLAGQIAEQDIDDYVALHWLEWHAGNLRLTTTGENMCQQMRQHLNTLGARLKS